MRQVVSQILVVFIAMLMVGCFGKEVRHLSSDVSMVRVGVSTKNDVLTFLGEPDTSVILSPGIEEWTYYEEKRSVVADIAKTAKIEKKLSKIPYISTVTKKNGYDMVIVSFKNDIVSTCRFAAKISGEYTGKKDHFSDH